MKFGERELVLAQEVVERTLSGLPPEIARPLRAVSVFVEDEPGADDLEIGVGRDWLGIFEGAAHGQWDRIDPPRIRIWTRNVWHFASGREDRFVEEVRLTLLHEIAHYLGMDEGEVAARGLG
ncbi:MAG: metallopeptidase family protein [Chthoniobacterales bacterium]